MTIMEEIRAFADRHLEPYTIRGDELIPEHCPICHGGENEDKYTFAINLNEAVYVCKRGTCGARGRFEELAKRFGETTELIRPAAKPKKQYTLPQIEIKPITDEIRNYFERRKIGEATLQTFGIGSDGSGNIVFPFLFDSS